MANWQTPKLNWAAGDAPATVDLNRIEGNTQYLRDLWKAGDVKICAYSTPPPGWLECNGTAVSRATYADLFTAIGTTFGTGDGSTTFNLPDLRGEFIRGWDHGRGVDPGRSIGSAQAADFKAHTHRVYAYNTQSLGSGDLTGGNGGQRYDDNSGSGADGSALSTSAGGAETRPRNVALMYCIKY